MATKPVNLRLEDTQIFTIKKVAEVFHLTFTDVIREALDNYLPQKTGDPLYRLTANVETVSDEENEELSVALDRMTDEDLEIVKTEVVTL